MNLPCVPEMSEGEERVVNIGPVGASGRVVVVQGCSWRVVQMSRVVGQNHVGVVEIHVGVVEYKEVQLASSDESGQST